MQKKCVSANDNAARVFEKCRVKTFFLTKLTVDHLKCMLIHIIDWNCYHAEAHLHLKLHSAFHQKRL